MMSSFPATAVADPSLCFWSGFPLNEEDTWCQKKSGFRKKASDPPNGGRDKKKAAAAAASTEAQYFLSPTLPQSNCLSLSLSLFSPPRGL